MPSCLCTPAVLRVRDQRMSYNLVEKSRQIGFIVCFVVDTVKHELTLVISATHDVNRWNHE